MCGFVGGYSWRNFEQLRLALPEMTNAIIHRGPDDEGMWWDGDSGIALGHRRLSIVDLSAAGHQPMHSIGGRWVIAFNGEIYNHLELRVELEAVDAALSWRGHSDTETLLAAVEIWGIEGTLDRVVGMFAIALWDRKERSLWLARDRLGEKPLYYGWQNECFLFGSELKGLRAHPAFQAEVDREALAQLVRYNYIPGPQSIWKGIKKLPAGTFLRIDKNNIDSEPVCYWSLTEIAKRGIASPFIGSEDDALIELERKLSKAVKGQMMSDVPLGALLSGGVDSTMVTALMQAASSKPVRTFTIGFDERRYDEASHAKAVAAHLGTEHTELRLTGADVLGLIPKLPHMYDEPFADSSQLPTALVMAMARQHVTVALSGDGADEFFGGYTRYFVSPRIWSWIGWMPNAGRQVLGSALTAIPTSILNKAIGPISSYANISLPGDKMHKLGHRISNVHNLDELYSSLIKEWSDKESLVIGQSPYIKNWQIDSLELSNSVQRMMLIDGAKYLPDDILVKVDRAAMAVSLETRAPFLDRDTVEFAWTLPMNLKIRDGKGKWLLRQLLNKYVPKQLTERPKMGFGIPLDDWLRGPLRDWAEDLLDEERLRREGFFHPEPIRTAWRSHLLGESAFGYRLWSILMFQMWWADQK